MIGKDEIIRIAGQINLNPHVVEKDYALGWLLAGIFANDRLKESWVFKGGTCLKKCFFETYRFSEDLDFTLQDASHLDQNFLRDVFAEIGEWVYEQSGLLMPADRHVFDVYENQRGQLNCQGRVFYRGPVTPAAAAGWPRIKLDLTADERIILAPVRLPIFHPYTDAPSEDIVVQSYAYEEAFGEKVRALAERTRPRDLYDVINLYRSGDARPSPSVLLDVLRQKCEFKGIAVPKAADLDPFREDLEAAWESMLRHQLPALPPVDSFWDVLPEFFSWLEEGIAPEIPASYAVAAGETILRERTVRLPIAPVLQSHLEVIRFAAANRLCIDLDYQGRTRRIEPYSLRRTKDGNIILHAWNRDSNAHRSYRVDRIQGARVTNELFTPRYAIELAPTGPVSIPPTGRRVSSSGGGLGSLGSYGEPRVSSVFAPQHRTSRRKPKRRAGTSISSGPTYVYQCGLCGKKFRRKKMDGRLNKHKGAYGLPCSGRTGMLVDTKY